MNQKTYLSVSGVIFLIIAVLHVLRIAYGWEAMIGGWMMPIWLSWIALVVSGYLAWTARGLMK